MVVVEAVYKKTIGLKNYSSHSYSISLRSEVADLSGVERESAKLYSILQGSVDREIQEVGFIPDGNGHGSPAARPANGHTDRSNGEQSNATPKQRDLVQKIIDEHRLDSKEVENLCDEMFRKPLKSLNKLEISGVIQELLEKYGPTKTNGGNASGRGQYQRGGTR